MRPVDRPHIGDVALTMMVCGLATAYGIWHMADLRAAGAVATPYDYNAATPLAAYGVALGALTTIGYLLCRRVSNRLLGCIGAFAFMTSPLQLYVLPSLEHDYMKALFVAGAALVLSHAITNLVAEKQLMWLAAIGGVILGVGFHYRQDVGLHAAVFASALLVLPTRPVGAGWRTRMIGALMFSVVFVATRAVVKEGPNALAFGPVAAVGGQLPPFDAGLAVARPPYDLGDRWIDEYVFAVIPAAEQLLTGKPQRGDALPVISRDATLQFVRLVLNTPSDFLIRAYASTVQVLDAPFRYVLPPLGLSGAAVHLYGWRRWIADVPVGTGLAICIAALAFVAGHDMRLAAVLLVILAYLGGYPSLSFQGRHYFHVELATWVATCYLLHRLMTLRRQPWDLRGFTRACAFVVVSAAMVLLPLAMLRAYQNRRIQRLIEIYSAHADTRPLGSAASLPVPSKGEVTAGFLMAEFDGDRCGGRELAVVARYEYEPRQRAPGRRADFSRVFHVRVENNSPNRLFFLALAARDGYGWFGRDGFSRFVEIDLREADRDCLRAVRRINATALPVLLNLWTNGEPHGWYQRFAPWELSQATAETIGAPEAELERFTFAGHITRGTVASYVMSERYTAFDDGPDLKLTPASPHHRGDRLTINGRLGAGGLTMRLIRNGATEARVAVTTPGRFLVSLTVPEDGLYAIGIGSNIDGFTSLEERFVIGTARWQPHSTRGAGSGTM